MEKPVKVTSHCRPTIKRLHNIRDPKIVKSEKHIDESRHHETILDMGTMEECYEKIFGEAVKKYNAKQKRSDRKIGNYLAQIMSDRRHGKHKNLKADGSRKPAYEMILQLGNRDNHPDSETAIKVLKDFCEMLPKKYPNIMPIGIYLHDDEFSIDSETGEKIPSPTHIHFDFVYIAHLGKSLKTGLEIQASLSGALAEMGFVTSRGKGTAQTQFEESVRHSLQDFAEERGLKIDRTPGEKHAHDEKGVYQQKKENEREKAKLEQEKRLLDNQKESIERRLADLNKNIEEYNSAATELNAEINENARKELELSKKEREQARRKETLDKQERELKHREDMVSLLEAANERKKRQHEEKEAELSGREKVIAIGEAPLIEKQRQLEEKEKAVLQKLQTSENNLSEAKRLHDETKSASEALSKEKESLEAKKKQFEKNRIKFRFYAETTKDVEEKHLSIDCEEKKFRENLSLPFSSRLNVFVSNVKKIVTSVVSELNAYKSAFKEFWTKKAQDFRLIADAMERNDCNTFVDYHKKKQNGELDWQIAERKQVSPSRTQKRNGGLNMFR